MFPDDLRHVMPFAIPLVALMIPIVAIVSTQMSKSSRERQRQETIREIVKAGQPIPPELLGAVDDVDSDWHRPRSAANIARRYLMLGVINISLGLGLMGMFRLMLPEMWLWGIGLIPVCLGLGFVLLWNLERKQPPPSP